MTSQQEVSADHLDSDARIVGGLGLNYLGLKVFLRVRRAAKPRARQKETNIRVVSSASHFSHWTGSKLQVLSMPQQGL